MTRSGKDGSFMIVVPDAVGELVVRDRLFLARLHGRTSKVAHYLDPGHPVRI